jgi:hypothetical protein
MFAEQVVRVLTRAQAGRSFQWLDWRRGISFGLSSRGHGKNSPADGADAESDFQSHESRPSIYESPNSSARWPDLLFLLFDRIGIIEQDGSPS